MNLKSYLQLGIISFSLLMSLTFYGNENFVATYITQEVDYPTSTNITSDGRIIICEQNGQVNIIENGVLLEELALELEVDNTGERGLVGSVLDPDFDNNGYIYLFYSAKGMDQNNISRFTMAGNSIIPSSELLLLTVDSLETNLHNSGAMKFGPYGKLYIAVGDNLKTEYLQEIDNYFGKILRINPDGSIPEDNPFYTTAEGKYRAIYALGFRNPFSMDINQLTGQIFVNDVGTELFEEVNEVVAGGNYGYPLYEGEVDESEVTIENYHNPIFSYSHDVGCAVVGASFYTPESSLFPEEYYGKYLFGDLCNSQIYIFDPELYTILDTISHGKGAVSNIAYGNDGKIFLSSVYDYSGVSELSYLGTGQPIITKQPKNQSLVVGENITIDIEVFSQTDYSIEWYKNDSILISSLESVSLESVQLTDSGTTYFAKIINDSGSVYSDTITLSVTENQRPVVELININDLELYSGGDTLLFTASIMDDTDGSINPSLGSWSINLNHDEHYHPALPITYNQDTIEFIIPLFSEVDTNVNYTVYFQVYDNQGLPTLVSQTIHPEIVEIEITSNIGSNLFYLDGREVELNSFYSTSGQIRYIEAPKFVVKNDSIFEFVNWENPNMTNGNTVIPSNDTTLTMLYDFIESFSNGEGTGFAVDYYENTTFTGIPALSLSNQTIDFIIDWGSPNNFSSTGNAWGAHWYGYLLAPATDTISFSTIFDDAIKVIIDDSTVVNLLDAEGDSSATFKYAVKGGEFYKIDVYYLEIEGNSEASLTWEHRYQTEEILPTNYIYQDTITGLFTAKNYPSNNTILYPNPALKTQIIHIASDYSITKVQVYNSFRELIMTLNHSESLDVSSLNSGIYLIDIVDNRNTIIRKKIVITD